MIGAAVAVVFVATGGACSASPDLLTPRRVAFEARMGETALVLETVYEGIGTGATADDRRYVVSDLRFYVSDLALVRADGREEPLHLEPGPYQTDRIALLDFESTSNSGTIGQNHEIVGTAPAGEFVGVCFSLGVPRELNHLSADSLDTPAPLSVSGMLWAWQSGRKFLRLDGRGGADAASGGQAFFVHLGSTGCVSPAPSSPPSEACAEPNLARVCLNGLDAALDQVVVVDIAALLATSDVSVDTSGATGCMSSAADDECAQILPRLDLPFTYAGTTVPAPVAALRVQAPFRLGLRGP